MNWNPTSDSFCFTWTIPAQKQLTKRTVLSTIARFFDPLGLLSPITITAKVFIQELWSLKLDWDDPLPSRLTDTWINFSQQLQELSSLTFPRWLGKTTQNSIEIHEFCDASRQALAAVVYLRSSEQCGKVQTVLICSKTKVAPIKRLTIPRFELSAAVLVTKLVSHVLQVFDRENIPVHIWTDSAIVHTWINNHPSRWKDFIHNRIYFIQKSIPSAKWHFIPGKQNPADCATRGFTAIQLSEHSIWWNGPNWLQLFSASWPSHFETPSDENNLETRSILAITTTVTPIKSYWQFLMKYSDLNKLLQITALCKRFIQCGRLSKGESLPSSHYLSRLTPFIDSQGLVRLGGRLQASLLPFNSKHPFILPKEFPFTQLIISDAHQRTLHGVTQDTLSYIKNEFWILGGRIPQLMGQLLSNRVIPSRPFLHSGVDYAGPFSLKTWKAKAARTYKAYFALFVCNATSAIHLELVTDYTADAFIAAFKRFTARRGICSTLRSDCGTNFKGADAQLRALFSSSSTELGRLSSLLAKDGTQWLFNPPAAPHFGGKWEAVVKSVKVHLKRVIGRSSSHLRGDDLRTEQPSGLETGDVRLELSRALALWSENSKLTFQEVNSDRADILVFFHRGYHGDGYPFDGRGKILAHAFFPGGDRGGDAHFDEEEIWLLNGDDSNEEGTSLFAVAAHEFGHSLGLSHSSVRGALMYPWYQGITSNYKLPEDDRNGIQQMYGAPENKLWAYLPVNPRPRRPTPTTTTTPRITTTTYRPWKTRPTWSHYPNYYPDEDRPKRPPDRYPHYRTERPDYRPQDRYPTKPDIRTERPDYRPLPPKRPHVHHHTTSTTTTTTTTTTSTSHRPRHRWTPQVNENIPDKCDTSYDAISIIRREVFIFKGRYLWRIGDQGLYEGFPAEISRLFNVPKDTDHVDAVYERLDKKIVFFIGKFYYVFSANILESGYPKPLTTLGLPASLKKIDGAMVWGHNKRTYFFSGTMYWRLDETTNSVELDYPRDMSMFAGVGYNIDAVFQWKNGKTYFFKGKYFWEFDDVRMRVSHEKAKLSSTFWMNCSSEVDTNDIDEIPRRRTHWKISSSSASKISSSSLIILVLISTLLSRALTIRITL